MATFSFIVRGEDERFFFRSEIYYFLMVIAVFNAGRLTQKYIHSQKGSTN